MLINLAQWIREKKPSAMQRCVKLGHKENVISFALGMPDTSFFPHECFKKAFMKLNASDFQYAPPDESLKLHVVEIMKKRGVNCSVDEVFLTSGAQQGLSLLSNLLLSSGDAVIVEEKTYPGFLQAIASRDPFLVTVPSINTDYGLDFLESKLSTLSRKPALIYCIPDGHNPYGNSMTVQQREKLVNLSEQYKIPVIEDDPYGFISYEGNRLPPVKSFSNELVLYVGSFSKIFSASARLGWMIIPPQLQERLSIVKESANLNISTIGQRMLSNMLDEFDFNTFIEVLSRKYQEKRDRMVAALRSVMPSEVIFDVPKSGFFIWLDSCCEDTEQLIMESINRHKVAFIPGSLFSPTTNDPSSKIRLNFSYPALNEIDDGIDRLASLIKKNY